MFRKSIIGRLREIIKKLYEKSEIGFAVAWIIAYVVLASIGDNISADIGILKVATLPILETQKGMLYGILLILMGIAIQALSHTIGGSDIREFISGLLLGISVAEMIVGAYVIGKSIASNK